MNNVVAAIYALLRKGMHIKGADMDLISTQARANLSGGHLIVDNLFGKGSVTAIYALLREGMHVKEADMVFASLHRHEQIFLVAT